MVWHKLYASTQRTRSAAKAEKDLIQAVTLAAILVEQEGAMLKESFSAAPAALQTASLSRLSRIQALLEAHPQTQDAFSAAMTRC